jgi:hypothetical protein
MARRLGIAVGTLNNRLYGARAKKHSSPIPYPNVRRVNSRTIYVRV